MDNQKHCQNCEKANTLDSKFCKECGNRLSGGNVDSEVNSWVQAEMERLINAKKEELTQFAANIEDKIEINSRKRIDGWLSKGGIVGTALLLVGGLSAFVQVGTLKDTMQGAMDQANRIKSQADQMKSSIDNVMNEVLKIRVDFEKTKAQLEEQKQAIAESVEAAKRRTDEANRALETIRELNIKTSNYAETVKRSVDELLGKAHRVDNATFDVFIHHQETDGSNNNRFKEALSELIKLGFRISGDNVAKVQVNQDEVIYYSELNAEKAREIEKLLKRIYPTLVSNLKRNNDRGARELLLKLRG
jgi:hypothetical protein